MTKQISSLLRCILVVSVALAGIGCGGGASDGPTTSQFQGSFSGRWFDRTNADIGPATLTVNSTGIMTSIIREGVSENSTGNFDGNVNSAGVYHGHFNDGGGQHDVNGTVTRSGTSQTWNIRSVSGDALIFRLEVSAGG